MQALAAVATAADAPFSVEPIEIDEPRRDEGAGIVQSVGSDVRNIHQGDHVVLGYMFPMERLITIYASRDINVVVAHMTAGRSVKPVRVW